MTNTIKNHSDSALAAFGLQTRRPLSNYIVPAVGILSVGLLAGAGLGLLFSPRRGRDTREEIGRGINRTLQSVSSGLRRSRRNAASVAAQGDAPEENTDHGAQHFENGRIGNHAQENHHDRFAGGSHSAQHDGSSSTTTNR